MQVLQNPAVYGTVSENLENAPAYLKGGECSCGYIFFPMQPYGCEKCGALAKQLKPKTLKGEGLLISSVHVHLHYGSGPKAPFVVGTIKLNEGPIVRALLLNAKDELQAGDKMLAILAAVKNSDDGETFDLRFKRAEDKV